MMGARKEPKLRTRQEANAIVAFAFRNTSLEAIHAGKKLPEAYAEGYSRISDEEVKELMIEACEKMELLLKLKAEDPLEYERVLRETYFRYCRGWKE